MGFHSTSDWAPRDRHSECPGLVELGSGFRFRV